MKDELDQFSTGTATLSREFVVRTYLPEEDVPGTLRAVFQVASLRYGSYERVSFRSAAGTQTFRSLAGSHQGERAEAEEMPVVELVFSIPLDKATLAAVIDRIREMHRDEEPVIYVDEAWSTRAKTYGEKSNPNRFWNRPGYEEEGDA